MSKKRKANGMPKSVIQGVRILGRTSGRPASLYGTEKAGIAPPESPLEKTIGQLGQLDPRVVSVKGQPFTVDVVTGRLFHSREALLSDRATREKSLVKLREYTPDFLMQLIDGRKVVVEVKDEKHMGDELYWEKVNKAEVIMRANGYHFLVVTMAYEPDHPLVQNAALLTTFMKIHSGQLSPAQVSTLARILDGNSRELREVCTLIDLNFRESPVLILRGHVSIDLKASRVGAQNHVVLAHGDLSHLELLPLGGIL